MSQILDSEVKSLKDKQQKLESLGRGNGALVIRRIDKTITGYFRYWVGKRSVFVRLGTYQQTAKSPGLRLTQLRDKALDMASLRKQVAPKDLKQYLRDQAAAQLREEQEAQRKIDEKRLRGSLRDLLGYYENYLKEKEAPSIYDFKSTMRRNLYKPFPEMLERKAGDLTSDDFVPVLSKVIAKSTPSDYNLFRAFLSAAFNRGVKQDYDLKNPSGEGKRFFIQSNPITPFPLEPKNALKRRLNNEELRTLWQDIEQGNFCPVFPYDLFVQFCITCFGIRPTQLARVKWKQINLEEKTITFVDKKKVKPVEVSIPLIRRSMEIIKKLLVFRDSVIMSREVGELPLFMSLRLSPININRLATHIKEYRETRYGVTEGEQWKTRALRKTANSILTNAGVIREHRFLLQSRAFNDVEEDHYSDQRMLEKWEAARKFEGLLDEILSGGGTEEKGDMVETVTFNRSTCPEYEQFKKSILDSGRLEYQSYYFKAGYPERKVRRWFRRLLDERVIVKEGQRFFLSSSQEVSTHQERPLIGEYEAFRRHVLETGSINTIHSYVAEGYSERRICDWFKELQAEGMIEKVGQRYQLKQPEDPQLQENFPEVSSVTVDSYSDFRQMIVSSAVLKTQKDYIRDGYRDKTIRKWFKQLQAEGIIEKVVQRYRLKAIAETALPAGIINQGGGGLILDAP